MKKLGLGLMRLPLNDKSNAADVDLEQVKRMVDLFLSKGFTYFDTALMYHGCASEAVAGAAIVDRYPRNSFLLADKLHAGFFRTPGEVEQVFKGQLEKTGAGYFDYYLLHGVEAELLKKYEACGCFEWLLRKKAEGLVRHAGFSFHDTPELLDCILAKHPEMEFVQLQLNYLDWESEWIRSRRCYETARRHGKAVIVMEPVKGGTLARIPREAEEVLHAANPRMSVPSFAIRFAAGLDGVMMVLSGMSNLAQMEDNMSYMEDFVPLTEAERQACFRAADIINSRIAIPCTGCGYCTGGCPRNIAIPSYFSLYNEDMREHLEEKGWTVNYNNYDALAQKFGRAGDCLSCGQCESVCPQHLPIMEHLKTVSKHFDYT